jgi:hypothetical protein
MSSVDFIEVMKDHIKAQLLSLEAIEPIKVKVNLPDQNTERQLRHFRMLHTPKDNFVIKRDIVFNHKKKNIIWLFYQIAI